MSETPTEIEQLRGAVWDLAHALARRVLADWNAEREAPNDWPAGQEWGELAGSSQSIFRHLAYDEAGLPREYMIRLLCDESGYPKPAAPSSGAPSEP